MRSLDLGFCALILWPCCGVAARQAPVSARIEAPIRMLIWQEYLAPEVGRDLQGSQGYKVDTTTFLTNEMAMSRIINPEDKIEVAIISNLVYDVLIRSERLVKNNFSNMSRNYLPMFDDVKSNCIPFFWLVSGFLFDSHVIKEPPTSLRGLLALRDRKDIYLGIVDDEVEVVLRLLADDNKGLTSLEAYPRSWWKNLNFIIDIPRFSPYQGLAVFTWHGAAKDHLIANKQLKFALPAKSLQVGYDVACIVSRDEKRVPYLKAFLTDLTTPANTEANIRCKQQPKSEEFRSSPVIPTSFPK